MKCDLHHKSQDRCRLSECGDTDFSDHEIVLADGVKTFGKLGKNGTGIYNCLSTNGSPSGAMILSAELPGHIDNTAELRSKLYDVLLGRMPAWQYLGSELPATVASKTESTA